MRKYLTLMTVFFCAISLLGCSNKTSLMYSFSKCFDDKALPSDTQMYLNGSAVCRMEEDGDEPQDFDWIKAESAAMVSFPSGKVLVEHGPDIKILSEDILAFAEAMTGYLLEEKRDFTDRTNLMRLFSSAVMEDSFLAREDLAPSSWNSLSAWIEQSDSLCGELSQECRGIPVIGAAFSETSEEPAKLTSWILFYRTDTGEYQIAALFGA